MKQWEDVHLNGRRKQSVLIRVPQSGKAQTSLAWVFVSSATLEAFFHPGSSGTLSKAQSWSSDPESSAGKSCSDFFSWKKNENSYTTNHSKMELP